MKLNFKSLLVLVIVVGVAVGGAYGAGITMGKGTAQTPAQSQSQNASGVSAGLAGSGAAASGNPRAGAAAASGLAGGFGGAANFGTVQSISGNTLTISTQSGGNVQVDMSDNTTIRKTVEGAKEDLKQGVEVMITGQQGSTGNLTASSVQIVPAGGLGGVQLRGGAPTAAPDQTPAPASGQSPRVKPQASPSAP